MQTIEIIMKKAYLLVILTLFLVSSASAITFEKELITNVIVPQYDQPAEISLKVSGVSEGRYNIYTLTDVHITPMEHFDLAQGENIINIEIYPRTSLSARGMYTFVYYLRDFKGVNHEDRMTVKVVDLRDLIEISSEANYPGNEMTFFLRNKENARLKNLTASFSSIFFETQETFDLEPFETIEFKTSIDSEKIKKIPAGSYLLEARFNVDNGEELVKGKIYFGESKLIETEEQKTGFFIRTETQKKINTGNTIETIRVDISKNIISSSFSFFNEKPEGVQRQGLINNYHWVMQLGPGEEASISVKTNYFVPLVILVIILGAIFAFRKYNISKIEIKKSVSHVKTKGGEFALRVRVSLKAHRDLENVSIIEKIPAIVKVHEKFGGLKPSSINLKERRLQWNLGDLKSGEERIFSYVVYSKVGVVGKFSLPESVAVFEERGNISETFSNKVFFLSEQVNKVE
jgi:hypothetical protein